MSTGCSDVIQENWDEISELMGDPEAQVSYSSSESMEQIDDKSVELVVTSPPYPRVEMWEEQFGGYDEMHDMIKSVLEECYRVLIDGGYMCVNIGDATRNYGTFQCFPNHAEILVNARDIGFNSLVPIHWMKPTNSPNSFLGSGFLPPNAYVTLDTEYILVFRKGGPREFKDDDENLLRQASQYTKDERDVWFSQQWKVPGASQDGTAVFPREIPYRLIRMFSVLGDTVVDPFAGTGTTLEVGRSLGRSTMGYEINGDLKDSVKTRVSPVNNISKDDILANFVKNERSDEFGATQFVMNPNSLLDFS